MSSFFEKLKRGLGIEMPEKEKKEVKSSPKMEEEKEVHPLRNGPKKEEIQVEPGRQPVRFESPSESAGQPEPQTMAGGKEKISPSFSLESLTPKIGELAVDLYQTENELVILSAVAGIKPEKLDILIEQDVITISGEREQPEEKEKIDYFARECYFGPFSRKIISPVEIDPDGAKAIMKDGILFIRIPKIQREKKIKVEVEKE